jgi:hypothetical protein
VPVGLPTDKAEVIAWQVILAKLPESLELTTRRNTRYSILTVKVRAPSSPCRKYSYLPFHRTIG